MLKVLAVMLPKLGILHSANNAGASKLGSKIQVGQQIAARDARGGARLVHARDGGFADC